MWMLPRPILSAHLLSVARQQPRARFFYIVFIDFVKPYVSCSLCNSAEPETDTVKLMFRMGKGIGAGLDTVLKFECISVC